MSLFQRVRTLSILIAIAALFCACSDSSSPSGGGGGGAREFASGDLNLNQSYTHVFMSAKSVPYYCRYHGGPGGAGMSGVITVKAGGTPSKLNLSITSSSTLPSATIDVGDTITWTNNQSIKHTVESDN